MNRKIFTRTFIMFLLMLAVISAAGGFVAREMYVAKQIPVNLDLQARRDVASLSSTTEEIFTISVHGEDARIIRFTAVPGEDPEQILETTLEMKELLKQLIQIGFWELQIASPGNETIISVNFKEWKVSKKNTI